MAFPPPHQDQDFAQLHQSLIKRLKLSHSAPSNQVASSHQLLGWRHYAWARHASRVSRPRYPLSPGSPPASNPLSALTQELTTNTSGHNDPFSNTDPFSNSNPLHLHREGTQGRLKIFLSPPESRCFSVTPASCLVEQYFVNSAGHTKPTHFLAQVQVSCIATGGTCGGLCALRG
jgi:hypothetical protein